MAWWGSAIECLRERKGWSKAALERHGIIRRSQYNALLKAKRGPSVDVLDRLLRGMSYTWDDWAASAKRASRRRRSS